VSFRPDAARGNTTRYEPAGQIDASGNYKLITAGKDGAPPGWYKVSVVAVEPIDPGDPYAPRKSIVNRKYGTPDSGLAVEVVAEPAPGAYDLKLTR
jgi:hypothetical protein